MLAITSSNSESISIPLFIFIISTNDKIISARGMLKPRTKPISNWACSGSTGSGSISGVSVSLKT